MVAEIVNHLKKVAENEALHVDEEAYSLIARQATGSLRDAISLLDQLASTGSEISLKMAENVLGTATNQAVLELLDLLLAGNTAGGLDCIHRTLDEGSDPRQFARQVVDYLRNVMLVRMGNGDQVDVTGETKTEMAAHARQMEIAHILSLIRFFTNAANETKAIWQPALPLEMAFIQGINIINTPSVREPEVQTPVINIKNQHQSPPQRKPAPELYQTHGDSQSDEVGNETAGGELTIKLVNDRWRRIIDLVGEINKQTQALLRSSKPIGVKDSCLYLGFNGDFVKSKMEKEGNLEIVEKIFSQVLEMNITIRCVMNSGQKSDLPPGVEGDGMVATAVRDLGGQIVDTQ